MTHQKYAQSLRMIADWFEAHPEIGLPHDAQSFRYFPAVTREQFAIVAKALGSCQKVFDDDTLIELHRTFGAITFQAIAMRKNVCTRRVVGVKTIPERIIEAHTERERKEEIVEWDCDEPLLAETRE